MNKRLLLSTYAIIGAQMMMATTSQPAALPEPPAPPLPKEDGPEALPSKERTPGPSAPARAQRHDIGPVQAKQNREARERAGYKGRR